jgi:hypothetical protein
MHNRLGISLPNERLSDFQGIRSMEFVTKVEIFNVTLVF